MVFSQRVRSLGLENCGFRSRFGGFREVLVGSSANFLPISLLEYGSRKGNLGVSAD